MKPRIKAPPPGSILAGKYIVEGLLGVGGMGVVLTARHMQLDQKVAIKVLLPEVALQPEIVERFAREARAAAKIHGEHVARVIDVGALDNGSPFMVMEHLDGRDLAAELQARGPLPPGEVAHWIVEACEAIAQAHAAKIVHRDLKPSNLFLARQPDNRAVVKVLDFGISKVVDAETPALTKTSSLVGTPYYMSPEQLTAAKTLDARADIWALGVIMYELLVGKPPFTGESMPEVVGGILQNEPIPLDEIRPGLPAGLSTIIAQCMRTKPADRYQSVAAVAAALAPYGVPRDHLSAEKIGRVLGISDPLQDTLAPDTELAPKGPSAAPFAIVDKTVRLADVPQAKNPTSNPTSNPNSLADSSSSSAMIPVVSGAAKSIATTKANIGMGEAKTEGGAMSVSSEPIAARLSERPSSNRTLVLVAGVAVLLGGGLFAAFEMKSESPPSGKHRGMVATSIARTAPTTDPVPSASSAPSASSVPSESASSLSLSPSSPSSPSPSPSTSIAPPIVANTATTIATPPPRPPSGTVRTNASGAAAASSPPATATATTTATTSAAPAATPSNNPLEMKIK